MLLPTGTPASGRASRELGNSGSFDALTTDKLAIVLDPCHPFIRTRTVSMNRPVNRTVTPDLTTAATPVP